MYVWAHNIPFWSLQRDEFNLIFLAILALFFDRKFYFFGPYFLILSYFYIFPIVFKIFIFFL